MSNNSNNPVYNGARTSHETNSQDHLPSGPASNNVYPTTSNMGYQVHQAPDIPEASYPQTSGNSQPVETPQYEVIYNPVQVNQGYQQHRNQPYAGGMSQCGRVCLVVFLVVFFILMIVGTVLLIGSSGSSSSGGSSYSGSSHSSYSGSSYSGYHNGHYHGYGHHYGHHYWRQALINNATTNDTAVRV